MFSDQPNHEEVDDLDALLDEAMDIVDEQEIQHEKQVQLRNEELNKQLQSVLNESDDGGNTADWVAEMKKTFETLEGGMGEEMNDEAFAGMKSKLDTLLKSLLSSDIATDADRAELQQVQSLLDTLGSDPEEAARIASTLNMDGMTSSSQNIQEQLAALNLSDGKDQSGGADMLKMLLAAATQRETGDTSSAGGALPSTPPAVGTSQAETKRDGAQSDALHENIQNMLLSTFCDPSFASAIGVMRDAYGAWMEKHKDSLSDEDKERYTKQHAMTVRICDLLKEPIADQNDGRVMQMLELMHEFSSLGEPPKDLTDANEPSTTAMTTPEVTNSSS